MEPYVTEVEITLTESAILEALVLTDGTTKAIAERTGVREPTVKTHLSNITRKTGLHKRVQMAVWWMEERST